MPVRAMTSAISWAGNGQRCSPWPKEKCALLPPVERRSRRCGPAGRRWRAARPSTQQVARPDVAAAELGVAGGPAAGDVLGGGVLPEHLVHRLGDAVPAAGEGGGEPVVGEHQPQGVADPVGGRLVAGGHHDHQVLDDLLVGEARRVSASIRDGDVVRRASACGRPAAAPWTRRGAAARRARRSPPSIMSLMAGDQAGVLLVGEAVEPGQDAHRQQRRVVGDQVGLALGAEGVDQLVRELLGVTAQFERVDGLERVADHRGALAGGARPTV